MGRKLRNIETQIFRECNHLEINIAARVIRDGGLVAFPTETVYGLGANGLDRSAVRRIFIVKGRPLINPVILHFADFAEVQDVTSEIPDLGYELAEKFMPGPLTLILKRNKIVPDIITAGRDTVAVRVPKHDVARALIKQSGVPIAAPSANISQTPSGTKIEHVINDFNNKIEVVLGNNNQETFYGVESTILDLSHKIPVLLRPGFITLEDLNTVIGHIKVHDQPRRTDGFTGLMSPGLMQKHYAPKAEMLIVKKDIDFFSTVTDYAARTQKKIGVLLWGELASHLKEILSNNYLNNIYIENVGENIEDCLYNLYDSLRKFDNLCVNTIFTGEIVYEGGLYLTFKNRLYRAANNKFYKSMRS